MSDRGFFLAHRAVFDPGHWCAPTRDYPACRGWAWLDLCRMASHVDGYRDLERGQVAVSLRFLARRWCWSKSKVERYLAFLLKEKSLERCGTPSGTPSGTPPYTVYRIVKYDTYNFSENGSGTLSGTGSGTNRIHSKNTLKNTYTDGEFADAISGVFAHWVSAMSRGAGKERKLKLTNKRAGVIKARLEEGFGEDELKLAVDGCFLTKFNVEGGWTDLELICRNAVNVERFMKAAPRPTVIGPGGVTYV